MHNIAFRRLLVARALAAIAVVLTPPAIACRPQPDARGAEGVATHRSAAADSAALAFVRAFYASYARRGRAGSLASVDSVLTERPSLFAPELLAALQRDAAERAGAHGEIAGLDFDPFLNSQDPCERYEVRDTTSATPAPGPTVRIDIYAACNATAAEQPAVVAEVAPTADGAWAFVNFYYPGPGADDLLALLRRLHPARHSQAARSSVNIGATV